MNSHGSFFRNITWGQWIIVTIGALLFLLGVDRFVTRHRFAFIDAFYCCLALLPAALLLLVFDYVIHHARLVSVLPLGFAGLLAFSSPVWDVALGSVLMGTMIGPALSDWKYEKSLHNSAPAPGDSNESRE
ncbi:MAG TPA: hypothetical protein VGP66_05525 [Candidatus Acidoferrum sp.]|nr:hypothetical protein [Candidatus Acidoferrum sp.]